MQLNVKGRLIETDDDGYLLDLADWDPAVASELAKNCGLELTPAHWELVEVAQAFYREFELSPAMRSLVKFASIRLGAEKGRSVYFMRLFPPSPAKVIAKIAGLPRPTNCL